MACGDPDSMAGSVSMHQTSVVHIVTELFLWQGVVARMSLNLQISIDTNSSVLDLYKLIST